MKSKYVVIIYMTLCLVSSIMVQARFGIGSEKNDKNTPATRTVATEKPGLAVKKTSAPKTTTNNVSGSTASAKPASTTTPAQPQSARSNNTRKGNNASKKEDLLAPIRNPNAAQSAKNNTNQILRDKKQEKDEWIDTLNLIQPSLPDNATTQSQIDQTLTRTEQEQLIILWRATLERNKTIRFIVEKLAPEDPNKKRNQVLAQVLNTAIFLPFYALQVTAPGDTSALASYVGAGVASDVINGANNRDKNRIILTQTEMVIMFMMIDEVAERVRSEYRNYKQELIDKLLLEREIAEARQDASMSLNVKNEELRLLTQIRLRQLEREKRRIDARIRSERITLIDLCGVEAVTTVESLIAREVHGVY